MEEGVGHLLALQGEEGVELQVLLWVELEGEGQQQGREGEGQQQGREEEGEGEELHQWEEEELHHWEGEEGGEEDHSLWMVLVSAPPEERDDSACWTHSGPCPSWGWRESCSAPHPHPQPQGCPSEELRQTCCQSTSASRRGG